MISIAMPTRTKGVLLAILAILLSIAVWFPLGTSKPPVTAPTNFNAQTSGSQSKATRQNQQEPEHRSPLASDSDVIIEKLEIEVLHGKTGDPISGATVTWYDPYVEHPAQSTLSDSQGRAQVTTFDRSANILATSQSMFGRYASDYLSSDYLGTERVIRVPMFEDRRLEISVKDTSGIAVPNIVLRAQLGLVDYLGSDAVEFLGKTNAEGQLSISLSAIDNFSRWAFWTGDVSIYAIGEHNAGATIVPVTWSTETQRPTTGTANIIIEPSGWIEIEAEGEPEAMDSIHLMLGLAPRKDLIDSYRTSNSERVRFGPIPLGKTWDVYILSNHKRRLGNPKPDRQITGPDRSNQVLRVKLPIDMRRILVSGTFAPQGDTIQNAQLRAHIGTASVVELEVEAGGEFELPVWINRKDGDLGQCKLTYGTWTLQLKRAFRIPQDVSRVDLGRWEPQIDLPEFARLEVTLDGAPVPRCNIELWSIDAGKEKQIHRYQYVPLGEGTYSLRGTAKPPYLVQASYGHGISPKVSLGYGATATVAMVTKPKLGLEIITDRWVGPSQIIALVDQRTMDIIVEESDGRANHYFYESDSYEPKPHDVRLHVHGEKEPIWSYTTPPGNTNLNLTGAKAVDLRGRIQAHRMHVENNDLTDLGVAWQIVDFEEEESILVGESCDAVIVTSNKQTRIVISAEDHVPWFGHSSDGLRVRLIPLTKLSIQRHQPGTARIRIRLASAGLSADHREAARIASADDDWEEHELLVIGQATRFLGSYPPGAVIEVQQLDNEGAALPGTRAHEVTVDAVPKQIAILPW